MKYAVIGAGGMGIQYGVLLQEFAHKDVDFVDTWKPNVEKIREQGGAYVSQDGEDRHLVPINVYYPEEYAGQPDVWIVFLKQMQLDGVLKRCAHLFNEEADCVLRHERLWTLRESSTNTSPQTAFTAAPH